MDAQAKKKALYRAKLKAQKVEKRIESPLVRYNESDQPVCRVCDIVLKSESSWQAHQVSAKHREAVNNIKANAAAAAQVNSVKPEPSTQLRQLKPGRSVESSINRPEQSTTRPSSALPSDFFDKQETRRQKNGIDDAKSSVLELKKKVLSSSQAQVMDAIDMDNKKDGVTTVDTTTDDIQPSSEDARTQKSLVGPETKQAKGALPEGFFDDKNADLRARGITIVKPDIKDEYKEFEKAILGDLQEVDNRLEEEEYDAAEMIEEAETVEQRTYRERVERLKRKKMELKSARSANRSKATQVVTKEFNHSESSSDDDSDDNFTVDWRAKHL